MAKKDYSSYQQSVISDYYKNLDSIMLEKLSELVSELFLAETEKKQARLWERAHKAMTNLKIPLPLSITSWRNRTSKSWPKTFRTGRPEKKAKSNMWYTELFGAGICPSGVC